MDPTNYSYSTAGFNNFLTRSLDDQIAFSGISNDTLDMLGTSTATSSQELNLDQAPTSGSLGSTLPVGNITIDGVKGRISIFDSNGNEVTRVGALDD